ncbi:class I SAM-dependent methyltransferase [Streptomyces sp. NPDC047123]|uniref:class I SAM-dependent methyltransferase n=1 Tax=Streptomyces sp. NPDC047123 TaxID=3155622 RepID=UPI0033C89466
MNHAEHADHTAPPAAPHGGHAAHDHGGHAAHDHGGHAAHDHGGAHRHEHGGHGSGTDDQDGLEDQAEILDLDAEVLAEHTASITAWLPVGSGPRHIVDLGCGTGAGTLALLARFPDARVTAVDSSAVHLDRLREKAAAAGAADRVHVVQADLDAAAWPELGAPDLVWASASMHHMADPDRTLGQVRDLLAPGGLFAVVELAGFPRFLPEGAPEEAPGLEERCHAALDRHHAEHIPHRGAAWGTKLADAGFVVEDERVVTVDIGPPHTEAVGRYGLSSLRRMRGGVQDALTDADLTALDRLLDPDGPGSVARRDDLRVRTERSVWAARKA